LRPRHLQWLALPLLLALALPLVLAVREMPPYGEVNPALGEVARHYNEHALAETGATNIVTGIILDYRAYDTLIETTVLFTAVIGVLLALRSAAPRTRSSASGSAAAASSANQRGLGNGRRHHP